MEKPLLEMYKPIANKIGGGGGGEGLYDHLMSAIRHICMSSKIYEESGYSLDLLTILS